MQSADWVQYGSLQSANTRLQSAFSGLRLLTVTTDDLCGVSRHLTKYFSLLANNIGKDIQLSVIIPFGKTL
jgi:hypothetical protein